MPTQLIVKSYSSLLTQLKKVFIQGMERIEEEKVRTYWTTGEIISNYLLANKNRADYGTNLYDRLAEDLEIHPKTLQRAVKFYRAYPIGTAQSKLTWLHFLQLITIEDKSKRELFAQRAVKKEWGYRELGEAVRLDRLKIEAPKVKAPALKLPCTRSRLYTYQILEPSFIQPIEEHPVIDLGFTFFIQSELKGIRVKKGDLIESVKSGEHYSFKHSDATAKELYTYKALVERVVDGDTIWLNIDLGFDCWVRQKVRLNRIDAPELGTKKGEEAKKLVEAKLKETSFIVIKTHKSDKYDRYLADIFYKAGEQDETVVLGEGIFLNQELLDNGLAGIV